MSAGVGYGIIVDGAAGEYGPYRLTVTAAEGAVEGGLPPDTLLTSKTRVVGSASGTADGALGFGQRAAGSTGGQLLGHCCSSL